MHNIAHRCLYIDEISRLVIQYACPILETPIDHFCTYGYRWQTPTDRFGTYRSQNKATLRLALTCRAFLEPALDALWHTQFGLWHLVQCFPPQLYKVHHRRYGRHRLPLPVWNFTRDPTSSDWDRFTYYVKRVQRLYLNCNDCAHQQDFDKEWPYCNLDRGWEPVPSIAAYSTLDRCELRSKLVRLHKIVYVSWEGRPNAYKSKVPPFIPVLVGSSLEEMEIHFCPSRRTQAVMQTLLSHPIWWHSLKRLHLTFDHMVMAPSEAVAELIPRLQNLTTYTTNEITPLEYIHLASLPHLEVFTGDIRNYMGLRDIALVARGRPLVFRALKTLHLHVQPASFVGDDLISLLEASSFPSLQKLGIFFVSLRDSEYYNILPCLFEVLSTKLSPTLFKDLEIGDVGSTSPYRHNRSNWNIDIHNISFMFAFRNLERLVFCSPTSIFLSDADLVTMSMSWPRLTELRLEELDIMHAPEMKNMNTKGLQLSSSIQYPRPTLAGVLSMARGCAMLQTLCITFIPTLTMITDLPTVNDTQSTELPSSNSAVDSGHVTSTLAPKLSMLIFPNIHVDEPEAVAKFIHANLPNFKGSMIHDCFCGIEGLCQLPQVLSGTWETVRDHLQELAEGPTDVIESIDSESGSGSSCKRTVYCSIVFSLNLLKKQARRLYSTKLSWPIRGVLRLKQKLSRRG